MNSKQIMSNSTHAVVQDGPQQRQPQQQHSRSRGFMAGVFSGIVKLSGRPSQNSHHLRLFSPKYNKAQIKRERKRHGADLHLFHTLVGHP